MEFDKENYKSTLYQDPTYSNHLKSKTQTRSCYNSNNITDNITVMTDKQTNEQMNI